MTKKITFSVQKELNCEVLQIIIKFINNCKHFSGFMI